LLSVLTPQQLEVIQDLLDQIDENSGGAPEPVALQAGGTEPGGKPARDAAPGRGPTDRGQNRPTGFDNPPFSGRPRPGGGRDPFRQETAVGYRQGFAGDSIAEDRYLRAALRQRGCPVGNEGGLGVLRKVARTYGIATGGAMAMDAMPYRAPGDTDAALEAVSRVGSLSYAGHVRAEPPRATGGGMAYDQGSDPLSVGNVFPQLAARWAAERSAFAVPVNPASERADERRASRGAGRSTMA